MANENKTPGFTVVRLETFSDPEKDERWLADQAKKFPKDDFDREFRLIPVGATDSYPVFSDYQREHHESDKLVFQRHLRYIYRGWDFGKVHPCVEFLQPDGDKINVIYEIYGTNILLASFASRVLADSGIYFPGATFVDWGDASGTNERDDGRSSFRVLADLGIRIRSRRAEVEEGITKIAKNLITWTEGRPKFQLNPKQCPRLAEAMRGGYKRDPSGKLMKDGTHDHPVDALRYAHQGIAINIAATQSSSNLRTQPKPVRPLTDSEQYSRYGRI